MLRKQVLHVELRTRQFDLSENALWREWGVKSASREGNL
jgi:hypothetical protein